MTKCHCGTYASFNNVGETKGQFCVKHKEPNMINVRDKTCEVINCNVQPCYNIPGETKGRFCVSHKEPNIRTKYDRCYK